MKTNEIVKKLRTSRGYKQKEVAAYLKIPYTTYNNYESGRRKIGSFLLMQIAQLYGVTIDYLMGVENHNFVVGTPTVVAASDTSFSEDILFLKMPDTSMEPRIFKGDLVIIRKQPDVESGQIAAVKINGEPAVIKKVMKHPQGYLTVSLNASVYPPTFYTDEELKIVGKAIEVRGSLEQWN